MEVYRRDQFFFNLEGNCVAVNTTCFLSLFKTAFLWIILRLPPGNTRMLLVRKK